LFECARSQEVQNFFGYEVIRRREKYEDININSDIGVTAHGARSASGATTDAGADERTRDYCTGEREEDESSGAAGPTAGKT
jgi:hypothetical protein